ncbi:MAG: hypothetical protein IJO52_06820 [Clostridia bacterium]|nr:hypothetical protein [Clostridia bacterium]
MKRILASLLAIMMICSMIMVVSAERPNEETEVLKFNTAPNLDGVITEAEWGKANVHVDIDQKTTTFTDKDGADEDSSYDLWLRWDANYYYVGVVAPDDVHALAASEGSLWNGDAIQMGFDPNGPNSSEDPLSPWTIDDETGYTNMAFGLVSGEGNTLSSWAWQGPCSGGQVEGAKYNIKRDNGNTTYEIAIPWASIGVAAPAAGNVYGATVVRVLCEYEEDGYNGWLSWGTGICGPQDEDLATGSNAIRLSNTAVGAAAAAPAPSAPATSAPATSAPATSTATAPATADPFTVVAAVMAVSAGAALSLKKRR